MTANEDARRRYEGHQDVMAAADLAAITTEVGLQAGLAFSRDQLAAQAPGFAEAAQGVARETEEARQARLRLEAAAAKAQGEWRYVGQEVRNKAPNPSPEVRVDEETLEARAGLVSKLFSVSTYQFGRETIARQLDILGSTIAMAREPIARETLGEALADFITQRLEPVRAAILARQDDLERELREGRAAQARLNEARAAYDRALAVHALLVRAALVQAGREAEIGRFVRAQDAAYKARRMAGRSMKEEEGIGAVAESLGTTTDAIDAPPPPA